MSDDGQPLDAEERELASMIVAALTRAAIRQGYVDPAGKTVEAVRLEASQFFLEHLDDDGGVGLVVDHTAAVLDQARAFRDEAKWDFALVFYAIFLEHWCNAFILDNEDEEERALKLIRHKSPMDKLRIVWKTSRGETLPVGLAATAESVFASRNDFVHYKFRPQPDEIAPDSTVEHEKESSLFREVEALITRLFEVEDDYLFQGRAAEFGAHAPPPSAETERQ